MYRFFFILYIVSLGVSILAIVMLPVFVGLLYKNNVSRSNLLINSICFIIGSFLFPTCFIVSLIIIFPANINDLLFKVSLVFVFLTLGSLILSLSQNEIFRRQTFLIRIIFVFFYGLLIGTLIIPSSVNLNVTSSESTPFVVFNLMVINYSFSMMAQIVILVFCSFLIISFIYFSLIIHIHSRDKSLSKKMIIIVISLSISLLIFLIHVFTGHVIFREFFFIIVQLLLLFLLIQYLKNPKVPIVNLTNKLYSINIYHKSGVQLYSYKFQYEQPKTESSIWGNILIGLNHIIGEFIDTNNQINVMQTKNSDIIVEYNNEYGFAVLLTTNKKSPELSRNMKEFTKEFESTFKNELVEIQDLNNLIDISEFKGVEDLIKNHFSTYFSN